MTFFKESWKKDPAECGEGFHHYLSFWLCIDTVHVSVCCSCAEALPETTVKGTETLTYFTLHLVTSITFNHLVLWGIFFFTKCFTLQGHENILRRQSGDEKNEPLNPKSCEEKFVSLGVLQLKKSVYFSNKYDGDRFSNDCTSLTSQNKNT